MKFFRGDHEDRLPTVRIHKAVLKDFKSVKYGELVFDCSKQFIPYGTSSDILGIYGQNGSGKTAFIEALSILKTLMEGDQITFLYSDCIASDADHAELEFTFDLQYPTNPVSIRKVVYAFSLSVYEAKELEEYEAELTQLFERRFGSKQIIKRKLHVYNEIIKIGGDIDGNNKKLQTIMDTSVTNAPFGPASKRKLIFITSSDSMIQLLVNKQLAFERSQSFIFMDKTIELFGKQEQYTSYFEVLLEMKLFSTRYLEVIDTKSMGLIQTNTILPLFSLRTPSQLINTLGQNTVSNHELEWIKEIVAPIEEVLPQFIPDMSIAVKELGPAVLENGKEGKSFELVVRRGAKELPIRCESDGVRKILSVMSLFIDAYNQQSTTIAIDELDAGIFEYLFGELLQIFAESGKGQLIFTSHNLRPLEVLDKKFIRFTTTNPENRYIHLKNVGASNNLRDLYFREVQMNEQDEEIYKATKKHKIIAALRKVGMNDKT